MSDAGACAEVGAEILEEGGTAVDSAVATLLCNGAVHPLYSGLGGGFVMTIYSRDSSQSEVLLARERAPLAASEDMFRASPGLATKGPLAVAVPGEVAGYWAARRKYGNKEISWQRILQPTIDLCRTGIPVTASLADKLRTHRPDLSDPGMRSVFTNPQTGRVWREGETFTNPTLANTLQLLAEEGDRGDHSFYNGTIAASLLDDVRQHGGILTAEDLSSYQVEWTEPVRVDLASSSVTLLTAPPPGSGAVLAAILNIVDSFGPSDDDRVFYHRLVESFKWAFAARSNLGDPLDEEITEFIRFVDIGVSGLLYFVMMFFVLFCI